MGNRFTNDSNKLKDETERITRDRDKLSRTLDGIDMIRNDNRDNHMNRDNGSS